MELVLVGVNHRTAPVETRERFAVLASHVPAVLQALFDTGTVRECCVLSTCNRTEIYGLGDSAGHVSDAIVDVLCHRHGCARDQIQPYLYHRFNEDVARHLFTVASGLDSMIVGEGQILAQVREAHRLGVENQGVGSVIGRLFERALHTGKRARTETRIAQGASSVSAAAVELGRKIHGNLARCHVLVVGTGKMGLLTGKLLVGAGVEHLTVLSRTLQTAQAAASTLAGRVQTHAASTETLPQELAAADIVIACTGSPVTVISRAMVASILRQRKYRPLFIVDIAVPRDVEASVNDLENVYLYDIDDLSEVVTSNLADRQAEFEQARAIVEDEVEAFARHLSSMATAPAIRQLREVFEQMRKREVGVLLARGDLSEVEQRRVEMFSRSLVNRLLHGPTVRIKDLACTRNIHDGVSFLMDVFADPTDDDAGEGLEETTP